MSALTPRIAIENRRHGHYCSTCGVDDGTIRCLVFSRLDPEDGRPISGSTAVAVCAGCRQLLADVLAKEVA